jgi:hypothetical protein
MPEFGFLPLVWSGVLDLHSQIWCYVGFALVALQLQRSGLGSMGRAIVSLSKVVVYGHLCGGSWCVDKLAPAGHSGWGGGICMLGCAAEGWQGQGIVDTARWRTLSVTQVWPPTMMAIWWPL